MSMRALGDQIIEGILDVKMRGMPTTLRSCDEGDVHVEPKGKDSVHIIVSFRRPLNESASDHGYGMD